MEQINFYTNGSPKRYKAISQWLFMSNLLFLVMIIGMASLYLQQWYSIRALKQKKI